MLPLGRRHSSLAQEAPELAAAVEPTAGLLLRASAVLLPEAATAQPLP